MVVGFHVPAVGSILLALPPVFSGAIVPAQRGPAPSRLLGACLTSVARVLGIWAVAHTTA
eukprot:3344389-Alexandrium_andersonii.AAC.1